MSQVEFDAEVAARIESLYRIGDALRRRRIVREALGAAPGERILDVGCGPGFYCAELAEEVGPSGSVVGVDSSPAMLELAARRCRGQEGVELRVRRGGVAARRRRQLRRRPVRAGARVRRRPDGGAGRDAPSASTRRPGGRVGRRLGNRLAVRAGPGAHPTGAASLGSAPDPPFVAAHTCAAAALGRLRGRSNASAPVHDVRVRPETYGAAMLPFIGTFVVGREEITEAEAQAWLSEQQQLGARGEFYFASHPALLHGHEAVPLNHQRDAAMARSDPSI